MCGIAGVFHSDPSRPIDPQILVNMAAIQHHRGPDGFGYQSLDNLGIGFSHARLSIIDLNESRGRQPFVTDDQKLMLTKNGELYDYQRIRAQLTADGAQFKTKSDSEIILHLYPRYGLEKTLEQLRGEFAFALYDREQDELLLVRDRFGIKPLYWTQTSNGVVFGSELKVLFAHPEVEREIDEEGLYHQLIQVMVPGSTAFKGVHQVKPGHVVKVKRTRSGLKIEELKFWDINFPQADDHDINPNEDYYIEAVREQLLEAVQHRLTADVPVGAYLSGGIDSCSILGLSQAVSQEPVKAFTIGFDDKEYDETPIAKEMADKVGADQHVLSLSAEHLYENFERTIWHTERTIYNTLGVAKLLMSQEVNNVNYKVVLTGEGSDELFAGYPSFRNDMFLYGLSDLDTQQRKIWKSSLEQNNALFKGAMLPREEFNSKAISSFVGFTPTCLQPWLQCESIAKNLLTGDRRAQLQGYDPGAAIADTFDLSMLQGRHPLDKAQYVWIKTMLEGQILTWGGDRVDMANSMEARPAFLDHHLAEFATHVPPQLRIKGPVEKYVLKEAMKGLLPETLYKRQKFAFMAPPAHRDEQKWAALMKLVNEFASTEQIKRAGLLDSQAVESLIQRQSDDGAHHDRVQMDAVINHVIGVQIMQQKFVAADVPKQAAERAAQLGWAA
ncbi:MAG: asparagine synthase (glutamine-hydrolyzing) [Gammaproteobacteria bacterium]|nr:asparagine synthase (glutamine-hydrolyzing) [Gammaproteobacteria bacterium]